MKKKTETEPVHSALRRKRDQQLEHPVHIRCTRVAKVYYI